MRPETRVVGSTILSIIVSITNVGNLGKYVTLRMRNTMSRALLFERSEDVFHRSTSLNRHLHVCDDGNETGDDTRISPS